MAEIIEPSVPMDPACKWFRDGDSELRTQSYMSQIWIPSFSAFLPASCFIFGNAVARRPLYAGLHKTIGAAVGGFFLGLYLRKWRYQQNGDRDLMIYHYMCLHPEDFPPPARIKYRDVLDGWIPIR